MNIVQGKQAGLVQVVLVLLKTSMLSWSQNWNYHGFVLHDCICNYLN